MVEQAQEIWWLFAALMPLNGVVFALDGILIGAGDTRFLMWGMLLSSAVYVPVALLALDQGWGIIGVWWGLAGLIGDARAHLRAALPGQLGGFSPALPRSTLRARMLRRTARHRPPARAPGAVRRARADNQDNQEQPAPTTQPTSRSSRSRPRSRRRRRRAEPEDDSGFLNSELGGTSTLYFIGAALLVAFIAIGMFISRDAKRSLPKAHRPGQRLREEGPHKHKREAKAKARARGKAQKAARRKNR